MQWLRAQNQNNNPKNIVSNKQHKIVSINQQASFLNLENYKVKILNPTRHWMHSKVSINKRFWNSRWWTLSIMLLKNKKMKIEDLTAEDQKKIISHKWISYPTMIYKRCPTISDLMLSIRQSTLLDSSQLDTKHIHQCNSRTKDKIRKNRLLKTTVR